MNKHFFLKSSFQGLRFHLDFIPFTTFGKILYVTFQWVFGGAFISTIILAEFKKSETNLAWVSNLNIGAMMIGIFGFFFVTLVLFFFMSIRE